MIKWLEIGKIFALTYHIECHKKEEDNDKNTGNAR